MFPWVSDSQELHLKVKARNEAAALLQNKNLCSARLFLTGKRELKHTDESHVTDATKTGNVSSVFDSTLFSIYALKLDCIHLD